MPFLHATTSLLKERKSKELIKRSLPSKRASKPVTYMTPPPPQKKNNLRTNLKLDHIKNNFPQGVRFYALMEVHLRLGELIKLSFEPCYHFNRR